VKIGLKSFDLKDICFQINKGAISGIIGINDDGKSNFPKILAKLNALTKGPGEIIVSNDSLLEVVIYFHSELKAGENIFLNIAFLGMTKTEIKSKFNEIDVFSFLFLD
jgi:lipopolysaccharide transport system ATP-binding protein